MATISPYLNFNGNTEEAFLFYKSVFGGEFDSFQRFKDIPDLPGAENMTASDKEKIMHVSLPISKEVTLMGTDVLESAGHPKAEGNNISLSINTESEAEADTLFTALSAGGVVQMPLEKTFWNAYFGMFQDKFGIQWMINYDYK